VSITIRRLVFSLSISALIILSCRSAPVETENSLITIEQINQQQDTPEGRQLAGGLSEEIRSLVKTGILSSMNQALEIIRSRELGDTEFGRVMNGIVSILMRMVYPDALVRLPVVDLPQMHSYTRIIREAERGNYIRPAPESTDFFEHILPFIAINEETSPEILMTALDDLRKAGELRDNSVLPPFFMAVIYEIQGQFTNADIAYRQAYQISNECYPALAGSARVMRLSGNAAGAAAILSDLVVRFPDSMDIKRQLAITYYENRDWDRAAQSIDEILIHEPRNGDFLLMKAHIHIEQSSFSLTNTPLDTYASINPNNRFYLFLRARLQAEGHRNRDSSLNYLRSILRSNPNDEETLIYAVRLLIESQRPADLAEGRDYLSRLRQLNPTSIDVLSLSLRDAIQREAWQEAQGYLNRILAVRRDPQYLINAYHIERALGNNPRALAFARELYERETTNNEYAAVFISALIDNNRREEASNLLESRIISVTNATARSQLFFLRSRLRTNEDAALGDLRSALFEDPRNLDALIAMFEIHHRRREERRAVHYLRQALAISPDNPQLRRFEREYAHLLGR
jgi:Tfp pilus assembly protein PilF